MKTFEIGVLDHRGDARIVEIDACDEEEARQAARLRGFFVVRVRVLAEKLPTPSAPAPKSGWARLRDWWSK